MATYALTISPPRRTQSPLHLYNSDKPYIQRQLNRCSSHYILYPEFDINGRLHYHGIVLLNSLSSWGYVKSTLDHNIGYCCLKRLKTFKDKLGWLLYCTKEHQEPMPAPIMYHTFKKGRKKQQPAAIHTNRIPITDYFLDHSDQAEGLTA